VWYPIILSRFKSFHQRKDTAATSKIGRITEVKALLEFIQTTALDIEEKRFNDSIKGQMED
jgi:hypothetical protein